MSIRIALAGNPNCGKTTLFNLLTGSDCHVGNWPGVTVEKRSGTVKSLHGADLFDLPGIYSLRTLSDEEDAALGFLINERPDLIINVINSNDLERSLYLTVQLELLEIPVVAALNMTDVLKKRGARLDCTRLGELADSFINGALSTAFISVLGSLGASEWVKDLVCGGILAGLGSVCSFLPQIALLFFFLGLLEDCGYMARGAFIADYPLRLLGLGGKSFLPLFMGFGCSVPALMSTRTLHAGREKKICAAVIPFMSCSAKMPVYAMLISAFFPNVRWLAVILVYSLGIACACVGSLILKKTVFKGVEPPFIFELPEYRLPRVRSALRYVRDRLREFLKKAGAVLFPASVIIWALGYFDFSFHHAADARLSMLGRIGGAVSFIFSPLGLGDWRCCVALISGLVARETTVSTLGILMGSAQSVRDIISPQAACAFMSFSLLSMPCVAAVAALRRELGTKSTAKVLIFEFITAWTVSFMIYRLALLI